MHGRIRAAIGLSVVSLVVAVGAVRAQLPAPVRVGGNIRTPAKTHHVDPAYPEDARAARIQGVVIIEVTVDPQGRVSDTRVLRSIPLLDAAALEAVRQWEYAPSQQTIEGVEAQGCRVTPSPAQSKHEPVREVWYVAELRLAVSVTESIDGAAGSSYRLTNIVRGNPDRALFELPPGYRVQIMSAPKPAPPPAR